MRKKTKTSPIVSPYGQARVRGPSIAIALLLSCTALSGYMIKINSLQSESVGTTGNSGGIGNGKLSFSAPNHAQSVQAFQKFSGTCDPAITTVDISYSSQAWGPNSATCAADGTFSVGITLGAAPSETQTLSFSQGGGAPSTRSVVYDPTGINALPTGFDGDVNAMVLDSTTGKIYVGGGFYAYGSFSVSKLARLNPNGTLDLSFVAPGDGLNGAVSALALDSTNGKLYVGGNFTSYTRAGVSTTQNYLMRVNTDGSIDTTFVSNGGGFDNTVRALAFDSTSNKIYVGGDFSTYTKGSGTTQNRLTRLNADGSVDTAFIPNSSGFNSSVMTLILDSSAGKIYAGGLFTSYTNGATTTQNRLTRLSTSNGAVDTAFMASGGGISSGVYALLLDTVSGKIYVGGGFSSVTNGGTTNQLRLTRIAISNGAVDTTFVPAGGGYDLSVYSLALDSTTGKLYVGGNFTSYTNSGATTQNRLSRLNADGTADTTFVASGDAFTAGQTYAMVFDSDSGRLYAGGSFIRYTYSGTTTPQYRIARLNSNGSLDSNFVQKGEGFSNTVYALALDPANGKFIAGGTFTGYYKGNSSITQNRVARINSDGTADTSLIPNSAGFNNSAVMAMAYDTVSGKLYAGGSFSSYTNGATTTQNYLSRINADGTVDTGFLSAADSLNNIVSAIALDSTLGKIYVGGSFTIYTKGAATTQNRLMRLDSSGNVETTFVPDGGGFNNAVNAVVLDSVSGKVYVGGAFTTYTNGSTVTQNRLTRLNSNGTVDTSFVPDGGGFNSTVSALALDSVSGKLYVGGAFTTFTNGSTVTQNYITRLNPNGTVDTSFVPNGGGFNASGVNALVIDPSTRKVYAAGAFTSYTNGSTVQQSRLTRLNTDGSVDTRFIESGTGLNGSVYCMAVHPTSGRLYVGGSLTSYRGVTSTTYLVLESDGSLAR